MRRSIVCIMALAGLLLFANAPAEASYHAANPCAATNPCAANPCAAKAVNPCGANPCAANPCAAKNPCAANPCAAKNPCAANPCNPCAAKGMARGAISVRTVWGQVVSASPRALVVRVDGNTLNLQLTKRTKIKMATRRMDKKTIADLRPGTRVAVSFVDNNGSRRAAYVYVARAAANPCGANPCAANPCAANPCAANPCAAKNPCAANPCNPCAAKTMNPCNPCGGRR